LTSPTVAVFGSSATLTGQADWSDAETAGRRLAEAGVAVVTGGYGGTMEAASAGAAGAGGRVIGVVAPSLFPTRPRSTAYVTELIEANSLPDRIGTLIDLADAALVLPGAIGTAAELVLAWNHNQIARAGGNDMIPVAAVGRIWAELCETIGTETSISRDGIYLAGDCVDGVTWILGQLNNH
jgi:uncharacterized protein (TIGR00730 family)